MRKLIGSLLGGVVLFALFSHFTESEPVRAADPPQLRRVRPGSISTGAPTFTIRLEGRNFAAGAKVVLDGVPLASSRINATNRVLLAEVDASVVAAPGTHTVTALNSDGMTSASQTLTVVAPEQGLRMRLQGNAVEEDVPGDL